MRRGSAAKLQAIDRSPRSRTSQRSSSSKRTSRSSKRPRRQGRLGPAQGDSRRCQSRSSWWTPLADLVPVELGALEGLGRLGVGHVVRGPAEGGELAAPALAHQPAQLGVLVVGEVEERRGRAPLLALEQHGHRRPQQHQRGRHLQQARPDQHRRPLARGPVADLVVVLQVGRGTSTPAARSAAGRGGAGGTASSRRRARTPGAGPWPAARATRSRRSSRPARR